MCRSGSLLAKPRAHVKLGSHQVIPFEALAKK
jgi:hypothetical protein